MNQTYPRTAEHVSNGHPDKFCDQVADKILDKALSLAESDAERAGIRIAIECLAKDHKLLVSGEVNLPPKIKANLDVPRLAQEVWEDSGYGHIQQSLDVSDQIQDQSLDIAKGGGSGTDSGGAGDQGIMVGYATDETEVMLPKEWVLARDLCNKLKQLRIEKTLPWLLSDCKTQVSLDALGNITSVVIAAQHKESVSNEQIYSDLISHAVSPILGDLSEKIVKINGTGRFHIGGPMGDAGVVGRKIVVDAYGPRVPVGGGAYSGKDPSKVDRSAAYMARHIAKSIVREKIRNCHQCTVTLAYCIGNWQPEMVTAITDSGDDVSSWVKNHFPDLSPKFIIGYLELLQPNGWSYFETASFGHYGRNHFPWEQKRKT